MERVYAAYSFYLKRPTMGRSKRSRSFIDVLILIVTFSLLFMILSSIKTITIKKGAKQGQKRTLFPLFSRKSIKMQGSTIEKGTADFMSTVPWFHTIRRD